MCECVYSSDMWMALLSSLWYFMTDLWTVLTSYVAVILSNSVKSLSFATFHLGYIVSRYPLQLASCVQLCPVSFASLLFIPVLLRALGKSLLFLFSLEFFTFTVLYICISKLASCPYICTFWYSRRIFDPCVDRKTLKTGWTSENIVSSPFRSTLNSSSTMHTCMVVEGKQSVIRTDI